MPQVHTTATVVPLADAQAAKHSQTHGIEDRPSSEALAHVADLHGRRKHITTNCIVTAYAAEMLAIHIRRLSQCIEDGAPDTEIVAALDDIDGLIAALRAQLAKLNCSLGRPDAP
jgi:hypothetical protein